MMDKQELLRQIKLFVLDMDGTFYLGEQILDGSLEFLSTVQDTGRSFVFFTNNSSKSPDAYVTKLAGMNCHVSPEEVMTSGDVTINYLHTHYPDRPVYLVGTPVLEESFRKAGIRLVEDDPELVVVGFDMTLNYHKIERAATFIRRGATFLATHLDINCPTEHGDIPDCGSFCAMLTLSTGVQPKYLGKPFPETVDLVLDRTGFDRSQVAFVGDRLYTDVATGVNNGAHGLLVLTGETQLPDLVGSAVQPDAVFASLGEIAECLKTL
ncbi:MAG: HAD-IIA family hydrolase [Angelakisella sp.]